MSYKNKNDEWGGLIVLVAVIGCFIFWHDIGKGVISRCGISWWSYTILSIVFFLSLSALFLVYKKIKKIKTTYAPCPHGIKGGLALGKCGMCHNEKKEQEEKHEAYLKETQLRSELRNKVLKFRQEEAIRVTKLRLQKLEYLLSLTPNQFEDAIAEMYRKLGYMVKQTPYTNDFGKDAIVTKDGGKYVVECKRFGKGNNVGRPHLQKFFAAMKEEKVEKGFFVTTSDFSTAAIEYGRNNNIELIDSKKLLCYMNQAFSISGDEDTVRDMCPQCGEIVNFSISKMEKEKQCSNGHAVINNIKESPCYPADEILCNKCGRKMLLKVGSHGKFWACEGYPACRNTKSYSKRRQDF
jgi:HJR/Mrr/RecB family endonuclease